MPGVVLQSVLIGGGYATGREIIAFGGKFGAYGWISGAAIFVGFSLLSFLTFEVSRRFQAFDYRSLVEKLIGRFWFLYDILYLLLAVLMIAVMAAATGNILRDTLGVNYWVGVCTITVLVGILNFFGEGLIERFETLGTLMLMGGFLLFSILVISTHWESIGEVFESTETLREVSTSPWTIIGTGFLYVCYNLVVYPSALFTVKRQQSMKDTFWAGLIAGIFMSLPWFLTYFSLMAYYPDEAILNAPVPWLEMLGEFGPWVVAIYGVVVGWTLIETATGMIYAFISRINEASHQPISKVQNAFLAVATLFVAMLLAQVGMVQLISKGYTLLGLGMLLVYAIPLVLVGTRVIIKRS